MEHLNRLDLPAWRACWGAVFEHSPWVAEGAWRRKERFGPFASADELHRAMMRTVEDASPEQQLALVRAHPELAGGEALTVDSTSEQGRLGFSRVPGADRVRRPAGPRGARHPALYAATAAIEGRFTGWAFRGQANR